MLKNHKIKIVSIFLLSLSLLAFLLIFSISITFQTILYFKLQSLAILLCGVAFMAVTVPHPVFSVLYLVLLFLLGSMFCLSLGLEYMGLVFLIVYVGAIAVLFLFVIMMLDIKVANKKYTSSFSYRAKQAAIALSLPILGGFLGIVKFLLDIFLPFAIVFSVHYSYYFNLFGLYYDLITEEIVSLSLNCTFNSCKITFSRFIPNSFTE